MKKRSFKELFDQAKGRDTYWVASLIFDFTEGLHKMMEANGVSRSELGIACYAKGEVPLLDKNLFTRLIDDIETSEWLTDEDKDLLRNLARNVAEMENEAENYTPKIIGCLFCSRLNAG